MKPIRRTDERLYRVAEDIPEENFMEAAADAEATVIYSDGVMKVQGAVTEIKDFLYSTVEYDLDADFSNPDNYMQPVLSSLNRVSEEEAEEIMASEYAPLESGEEEQEIDIDAALEGENPGGRTIAADGGEGM
ncbi:MAG: hypothetical protein ABEJ98_04100 [Candidatus Nanohaloarchaea archaeon]